jgi:hypothetical protein
LAKGSASRVRVSRRFAFSALARAAGASPLGRLEPAFTAEGREGPFRVHVEIAGIGAHVAGDEARRVEGLHVAVFDRGDVGGLDAQLVLHVEQGFALGGAFAAHDVAKPEIERIEAGGSSACSVILGVVQRLIISHPLR